jgi:hypothetical protein
VEQRGHGQSEQHHAHDVIARRPARARLGQEKQAGNHRADAHRQVDQEHHAPAQIEQVGLDQDAAQHRPGNRGKAADHPEQRHARNPLQRREHDLDHGHRLGRHHRPGRALQRAATRAVPVWASPQAADARVNPVTPRNMRR